MIRAGGDVARDEKKRAAARRATEFITDGMVVGLGSGSTAYYAILHFAQRLREGDLHDVVAIPTSEKTAELARREGIPLTTLGASTQIDVTIDGADEVDPQLNVIKGRGGFLVREKIVAFATNREIIVVDDSKLVDQLGIRRPIPVEVVRFGYRHTEAALARTGARTQLRMVDGAPYVTDEGNYIIDCKYDGIDALEELALTIDVIPGVVEDGLFLGMVHTVVVGTAKGTHIIER